MVLGLGFLTPWHRQVIQNEESLSLVANVDKKTQFLVPKSNRWIVLPTLASAVVLAVAAFSGYKQNDTGTVRQAFVAESVTDWRHCGNTVGGTRFASINQISTDNVDDLKEVLRYDPAATAPGEHQYAKSCRAVSYHEDLAQPGGHCSKRYVMGTIDARLIAVDALNGKLCTNFGKGGQLDLRKAWIPSHPYRKLERLI